MGEWAEEAVEFLSSPEIPDNLYVEFLRDVAPIPQRARPGSKVPFVRQYDPYFAHIRTDGFWTTLEGEKIKFEDMTPEHRGNCIRLLRRKHGDGVLDLPTVRWLKALGTA